MYTHQIFQLGILVDLHIFGFINVFNFEDVKKSEPQPIVQPKQVVSTPTEGSPASPSRVLGEAKKCAKCSKRVGLLGFDCHCGDVFCAKHRNPSEHACGYDYQSESRKHLEKANPQVVSSKMERI